MSRESSLKQIVQLCRQYDISIDEILEELNSTKNKNSDSTSKQSSILVRFLAYIGGILIFCGICVLISLQWNELTPLARVIITLGTGFVSFILGATSKDSKESKVSAALFILAAFLEPIGLYVMLNEFFPESYYSGNDQFFVSGILLIQFFFTFISKQTFALLFFVLFYSGCFCSAGLDLLEIDADIISLLVGMLLFGFTWWGQRQPRFFGIGPFWFMISSALLFHGIFEIIDGSILFLMFSGWILYLSTIINSRTLVASSTTATIGYVGYYTNKYFIDSIGWPIALIGMGVLLILASFFAVKFSQKYIKA